MKRKRYYWLLFFSALILVISFASFMLHSRVLETKTVHSNILVEKGVSAFDLNSSAITFGKVSPGGTSTRNVDFYNDLNFTVRVRIKSYGRINDFISYDNNVIVGPLERKKISFNAFVPEDTKEDLYEGEVIFEVTRA